MIVMMQMMRLIEWTANGWKAGIDWFANALAKKNLDASPGAPSGTTNVLIAETVAIGKFWDFFAANKTFFPQTKIIYHLGQTNAKNLPAADEKDIVHRDPIVLIQEESSNNIGHNEQQIKT